MGTYNGEGIKAIADAIVKGSLTQVLASSLHLLRNTMFSLLSRHAQIDLCNNRLCGFWTEWGEQKGTYSAEGINAIADALVRGSLTQVHARFDSRTLSVRLCSYLLCLCACRSLWQRALRHR